MKVKSSNENDVVVQEDQEAMKETKKPVEEEVLIAETSEYLSISQTWRIWNKRSR